MILINNNQYCNVKIVSTVQGIWSLINSLKATQCFQMSLNLKQTFRELSLSLSAQFVVCVLCLCIARSKDKWVQNYFFGRKGDSSIRDRSCISLGRHLEGSSLLGGHFGEISQKLTSPSPNPKKGKRNLDSGLSLKSYGAITNQTFKHYWSLEYTNFKNL